MPVLNPVVTKLTAASNSVDDYLAAMFTHFGTSTKFSIVANGGTADAFTITPVAAAETWQLNLRWTAAATTANSAIDPLANIIDPGAGGGAAPTLTSDQEWSTETPAMVIVGGGAESVDFYLIELDDCLIVLFMDVGKVFNPRAMLYGRLFVPYYTDNSDGNDFCDGLAMCGSVPRTTIGTSAGSSDFWMSSNSTGSLARGFQNYSVAAGDQWFAPSGTVMNPASYGGLIDGNKKIFPLIPDCVLNNVSVAIPQHYMCGYTKYFATQSDSEIPGTVLDGGVGNDGWIHINYNLNAAKILLPWDRTLTPEF